MNQRFQFLNFTPGAGKVTVQAPANANLAPPGDYMLFLLDTNGVPRSASIIRLSRDRRRDAADRAGEPRRGRRAGPGRADVERRDRQRAASRTTTSTARRPPGSPRRRRTGSRSRPARATPTLASLAGPTTTRSPPRTSPATSGPRRTRRARRSSAGRRPARRGVRLRRGERDDHGRPVRQRQHRHALERDLGADREVRQRALLQRHERIRLGRRLELARPDDRDDARGLGEPDRAAAASGR